MYQRSITGLFKHSRKIQYNNTKIRSALSQPGLFCGARRRVEIDTDVDLRGYHPTWTLPSSSSSYALAFAYASSSTQLSFQSFICKVKIQIILLQHKILWKSMRIYAQLHFNRCLGIMNLHFSLGFHFRSLSIKLNTYLQFYSNFTRA